MFLASLYEVPFYNNGGFMPKIRTVYICNQCGHEINKWLGKCPNCNSFNTMEEDFVEVKKDTNKQSKLSILKQEPTTLKDVKAIDKEKIPTKISELDRVISGGIVQGSLILVGGDPGIGKSTLILQICQSIGELGKKILYISGEESINQIKLRSDRLNITTENLLLLSETNMHIIEGVIDKIIPDLLIIDSIQTISIDDISSPPGSVTQVRECTTRLMRISKGMNISTIIVGHVTKEGNIAGPKVLEHMVDTVLYFEGEHKASYRIIRAVKNRFGSTNEIGVFKMEDVGLVEISNPSEYMLSGRPINVSGSVITCSLEGTRPILTEVQALVSYTNFGMPRRAATGTDYNRVVMLMAVLEKKLGIKFGNYDTYVNIAGGIKIVEPALDSAILVSIASSYSSKLVDPYTLIFGEIGLTGEIRAVSMAEKRVYEAKKLGFKSCIIPEANMKTIKSIEGINIFGVSNINKLLELTVGS